MLCTNFFSGILFAVVVPQVITLISEQTVQATHQAVHEKCRHGVLGSAFSRSN
jgi:hypothetical protein